MDIVSAAYSANDVSWWENDGSQGFTKQTIRSGFSGVIPVTSIDIDGDTDMDVVAAAYNLGDISWWESDVVGVEEGENWERRSRKWKLAAIPNPFREQVTISLMGEPEHRGTGETEIKIYDISGRLAKSVKLATRTYQLGTDLRAGIYFLCRDGIIEQKIVKIK
jgi:hypothetical protein